MNYLLDKKNKRRKYAHIVFFIIVFFIVFYFRSGIWNGLSLVSSTFFRPVLILGNNIGERFSDFSSYFVSKSSLQKENKDLKLKLSSNEARMINHDSLLAENESLKEIFGRKDTKTSMILSGILSKPNKSVYDTLIIDAGTNQGISSKDMVFAYGNIPIGRVDLVYPNSSKVILFSNSGEKTEIVVSESTPTLPSKNIFMDLVGRGGGNFEMIIPRDFTLVPGDQVVLPGITSYVVGIVETIISDPRDPFIKALLTTPINIQELKFVEVAI